VKVKVENALNEARTLVLVVQILIGFELRAFFDASFDRLPPLTQGVKLGGLALELIAMALLLWPAARHRIVEEGRDTAALHLFVTRVVTAALLPFALALGANVYLAVDRIHGGSAAAAAGVAAALVALIAWYGVETVVAGRLWPRGKGSSMDEGTKIEAKVEQVLIEARVVLPGVQALLGFQLAVMFAEGFEKLPSALKELHLASLGLMALAAILLMTPSAYHRIVEQGESTERFHRVASWLILCAMPVLALGVSGDVYVVVAKVLGPGAWPAIGAGMTLTLCLGLWFGWTLWCRARQPREQLPRPAREEQPRLAA
jgi:hypothetical protein